MAVKQQFVIIMTKPFVFPYMTLTWPFSKPLTLLIGAEQWRENVFLTGRYKL